MSDLMQAGALKDLDAAAQLSPARLRLLSYNIQTGINTGRYRHYITQSWKHVLPHPKRFDNLDRIAQLIHGYDIVGLQELDAGSIRSAHVNLTQYLAERADYPYWYDQTNRRLGRLARHATGILSRHQPATVTEHRLPGRIPGRGVLAVRFGHHKEPLVVLVVHLSLGQRARLEQIAFISDLVNRYRHVILMGDLNCHSEGPEINLLLNRTHLQEPLHGLNTFPSWRPQRNIDHIMVGPTLEIERAEALNVSYSDHLPLAMEVILPAPIQLTA